MDGSEKQTPLDRINYSGELDMVISSLASAYEIGHPIKFSVIGIGYEDCNVIIDTASERYVAKIFSKERSQIGIERYTTIMGKAVEAGVNHPPLIKTSGGEITYSYGESNGISMVLMKFIDGQTFFDLDRAPNSEEFQSVIEQAVKINGIDYHPPYLFDSWAIPNIERMFHRVKQFIKPDDLNLVEQTIAKFKEIPVASLPHAFVHGDFTKANVMKGTDGKIYILDFSVANWYPRIQELAVIAANLLYVGADSISLRDRTELAVAEYGKFNPLEVEEVQHLYAYALAGVAMEFMGAHQEKFVNGNATQETEYWLNLGRNGLRSELAK